ncbi:MULTISPECIES: hypothetical protein [unclassified Streptomyces]|uniref:hypothetical protein n=1 Tax=unclassified Streptomyces TaxID=2593676 RepID=UPI00381CCABE
MSERDFIALLDGTHRFIKAPIVLVWDRLNTHVSRTMRELNDARERLTVFLLPAAEQKLAARRDLVARHPTVHLGMPDFRGLVAGIGSEQRNEDAKQQP